MNKDISHPPKKYVDCSCKQNFLTDQKQSLMFFRGLVTHEETTNRYTSQESLCHTTSGIVLYLGNRNDFCGCNALRDV